MAKKKKKNVPTQYKGQFGYGDVWTWTAICADTKFRNPDICQLTD